MITGAIFVLIFVILMHASYTYEPQALESDDSDKEQSDLARKDEDLCKKSNEEKTVIAINRLRYEIRRQNIENRNKERFNRSLKIAEIGGLWGAAAVGLIAIYVSNEDASNQWTVMIDQLKEMKSATDVQVNDYRADILFEHVLTNRDPISGAFYFLPKWTNNGRSRAVNVVPAHKLYNFDSLDEERKFDCSVVPEDLHDAVAFISPKSYITNNTEVISVEDARKSASGTRIIMSISYIEYSDVFGKRHTKHHAEILDFNLSGNSLSYGLPILTPAKCNKETDEE